MAIDWDAAVLAPVMTVFGEGDAASPAGLPVYTPRGLPAFRVTHAVFDAQYLSVETTPGDDAPQSSRRPVLGVRTALFPRPPRQGDAVYVPSTGKTYIVSDVQPDGHGHALLMLGEAAA